jgi:hypothetical protein
LKCPEHECEIKPSEEELREIIRPEVFEKFKKFELNAKVAQESYLIFCPTVNCIGVLNMKDGLKLSCIECKKEICGKCK